MLLCSVELLTALSVGATPAASAKLVSDPAARIAIAASPSLTPDDHPRRRPAARRAARSGRNIVLPSIVVVNRPGRPPRPDLPCVVKVGSGAARTRPLP